MKTRLLLSALLALPGAAHAAKTVIRVGYFPNVTHAQGVIGSRLTAEGERSLEHPGTDPFWAAFGRAMESGL